MLRDFGDGVSRQRSAEILSHLMADTSFHFFCPHSGIKNANGISLTSQLPCNDGVSETAQDVGFLTTSEQEQG